MSSTTLASSVVHPVPKRATSVGYYLSFIGLGLVGASLGPTLLGLADQTGTQLDTISILFTARALGYLGGSMVAGWVYDRRKGHPIVVGSIVAMALLMGVIPLVPLLWILVALLLLIGLAEGTMDVGVNTLIVWLHRPNVGPAMNALHFFFGVGAFVSPLIVAQVVLMSGGITWAYWAIALLLIPVALWLLRLPSPSNVIETIDDETKQTDGRVDLLLAGLTVLFFFVYVGAEISFSGWISTYAVRQLAFSETNAAYLNSGFWVAFTLGRLISIPLAARLRPRHILLGELVLAIFCVGLILIWPNSAWILWIGVCGTGLAIAALFPIMLIWAGRHLHITGRVTSWFFIGGSLGAMLFPWIIGQFIEDVGALVTMFVILGSLLLNLAVFLILMLYAGEPRVLGENVGE